MGWDSVEQWQFYPKGAAVDSRSGLDGQGNASSSASSRASLAGRCGLSGNDNASSSASSRASMTARCGLNGIENASPGPPCFPSYFRQVHRSFPCGCPAPQEQGGLVELESDVGQERLSPQSEEKAACPVTPQASDSRHLVSTDFVPGKVASPYSSVVATGRLASLVGSRARQGPGRPPRSFCRTPPFWMARICLRFCLRRAQRTRRPPPGG
jgi:hypothetical protein